MRSAGSAGAADYWRSHFLLRESQSFGFRESPDASIILQQNFDES
jgi:hypothetical protein